MSYFHFRYNTPLKPDATPQESLLNQPIYLYNDAFLFINSLIPLMQNLTTKRCQVLKNPFGETIHLATKKQTRTRHETPL